MERHNSESSLDHDTSPVPPGLKGYWVRFYRAVTSSNSAFLLLLIILTVSISAFDWVMWKKTLNRFHSRDTDETYTFFVLQTYVLMLLVMSFVTCMILMHGTKTITPEMRKFPTFVFFKMSCLDTFTMLCSSMAGAVVAGHLQTLLNQLNLPLTMCFSVLFLATMYSFPQYIGALFIIAGAVTAAVPALNASEGGRETKAWGLALYAFSIIPYSISNVYREFTFRDRPSLNPFYLMLWVSVFQFLLGFLTMPILTLEIFGGTKFSDMPDQLTIGWKCFTGQYVPGLSCETGVAPGWFLFLYVLLNFVVSFLRLMLIKYGSALLLQVTNAIALLTTNIIFCLPFVMGDDTESFSMWDALGLGIVVAGFLIFRTAQIHEEKTQKAVDEAYANAYAQVKTLEAEAGETRLIDEELHRQAEPFNDQNVEEEVKHSAD